MAGMQNLARFGEFEFEEVKELERQFAADLELVFEGKQKQFGQHLEGMLFELWARARGTKSDVVRELEELRELKDQRTELEATIALLFKEDEDIKQYIKQQASNVMGSLFEDHLNRNLQVPSVNTSMAIIQMLQDHLTIGGVLGQHGPTHQLEFPEITGTGLPEFDISEAAAGTDSVQKNLEERLRHLGVLPPEHFHESWQWAPVYFNTLSGEAKAFQVYNPNERFDPHPVEVRHSLAWDGFNWHFPNPRPIGNDYDAVTLFVDGIEIDRNEYPVFQWEHEFDHIRGEHCIKSVRGHFAVGGTEIVEAVYRDIVKTTVA